jgi:hypothetical protein
MGKKQSTEMKGARLTQGSVFLKKWDIWLIITVYL